MVVDGEDGGERFAASQVYQSRIGEIHGQVTVLFHECLETWKIGVVNREHRHRSGTQKTPRYASFMGTVAHEMEELSKNRSRCCKRQAKGFKGLSACLMPPVVAIQQSKNRSGVDDGFSRRDDVWQVWLGRPGGYSPNDSVCHP